MADPQRGLFLEAVRFKQDYRCFAATDVVAFHPGLNFLVGDQGCGKSTVIQLIRAAAKGKPPDHAKICMAATAKVLSFDFEKDLPRGGKSCFDDHVDMGFQISCMRSSHGEAVRTILSSLDDPKVADRLIVMDEPDLGLSPRSCHELGHRFVAVVERGCQIIASIHSPIVMGYADRVLSLEHRTWMTTADFLETQLSAWEPMRKTKGKKK
jgi:predicted ATPase